MNHVVLLGDNVFDNGAYLQPGEPHVPAQVRARLPEGWRVTMNASEGPSPRTSRASSAACLRMPATSS